MKENKKKSLSYHQGEPIDMPLKPPWGQLRRGMPSPEPMGLDERPRNAAMQERLFRSRNPEFKDGGGPGDWSSWLWTSNV